MAKVKTTKEKVAKKVAKKTVKKAELSPYSEKEMAEVRDMVETILAAPANVEAEELRGVVIVAHEDPKTKVVQVLGGVRNVSKASVMKIVLESLEMSYMDGAILMAELSRQK